MATYSEFDRGFLGPRTGADAREGAPLHVLEKLSPEDRIRAAQALHERLEEHDRPGGRRLDGWAVEGLGHLAALGTPMPEGAVSLLRRQLPLARPRMRATIALAIWQMTKDETMLDVVLALARTSMLGARLWAMLSRYGADFELIHVIHVLARFPQAAARQRLEELTRDPRYLVRYNAECALGLRGTYYGISEEP